MNDMFAPKDPIQKKELRHIPNDEFVVVDRHDRPSGWVLADPKPLPDFDGDEVEF